eukprot:6645099-Alexandrium_andersonii.AAC.1
MDYAGSPSARSENIRRICEYLHDGGIVAISGASLWAKVDSERGDRLSVGPDDYHLVYHPSDDHQKFLPGNPHLRCL